MMNEMESIDSNEAMNGPKSPAGTRLDGDGQPRVGELFFIRKHQEDDLSSINSYPTTYTETEMLPTFTYPQISNMSNYADSIVSESTTISSVTQQDIIPKKNNNRSILSAFRKKTVLDIIEGTNQDNDDEFLGYIPSMVAEKTTERDKTWVADIGHLKSTDTDPTVDLENQPSQEESTNSPDENSIQSKADSSFSSFSEGFGGYIYQNCSELNPFNLKLFIMSAFMLLLIGVTAVVAAVIVDGSSTDTETNIEELTSVYELPPWQISVPEPTVSSQTESESVDIPSIPSSQASQSPVPTDDYASNDGLLDWEVIQTSTLPSVTTVTSTVTSSPVSMLSQPSSTLSTVSSSTSSPSTSSPTTSSPPPPTTSSSSEPKLSAIFLQPVANSKLDKNDRVVRFDISKMLNKGRGRPFKVLMRIESSKYDGLALNYLPKAGSWDCSPCDESEIQSTNLVSVGYFVVSGDTAYLDIAMAFQRGIFDSQMTFQFHSHKDAKKLTDPELVVLWVEGDADDFASMSLASLMEEVVSPFK